MTLMQSKGRAWQEEILNNFPEKSHDEALEIMSLFVLARFRTTSIKEVMHMLNLDMESINTRLYNEGRQDGEAAMLLKLMRHKFGQVPDEITKKVESAELELIETWGKNILFASSLDGVFAS